MKTSLLVLILSAALQAQEGANLFRSTCAVAYCHGQNGAAGKAPKLAGRAWDKQALLEIIQKGRPALGMPSFEKQLKSEQIAEIAQYILSLGGPEHGTPVTSTQALPPDMEEGRALFFDAVRFGGCGRCHEINDHGVAIGPDLKRGGKVTLNVVAPAGEQPFPAVVVEQSSSRVRVYDLTSKLPVLRSFRPDQLKLTPGAVWSHEEVTRDYSDSERKVINNYVTWVKSAPK